jgi:hypothetical protein
MLCYFQKVAQSKNLKLVAYEGGSHIVGIGDAVKNDQVNRILIAINKHPRMYDIYTEILMAGRRLGELYLTNLSMSVNLQSGAVGEH